MTLQVYGITIDHSPNYGSCLQAYALQSAIERIRIDGTPCRYLLIPVMTLPDLPNDNRIKQKAVRLFMDWQRITFRSFDKTYMHYADIKSFQELPEMNKKADAFVCGSDVIWRPNFIRSLNDIFWLDFAHKYKFSYAASFGKKEIGEDCRKFIADYSPSFDSISVRENSGVDLIREVSGIKAVRVADPVLLLDKKDWDGIAGPAVKKGKYIFAYLAHQNPVIMPYIEKLRRVTGLKVVYDVCGGPKMAFRYGKFRHQSPRDWLAQLRDAEYIVTNSFHATAFALIFHKKVFTVLYGDEETSSNIRMYELMSYVGLRHRLITSLPDQIDLGGIDFTAADAKLKELRSESVAFLRHNLENAYRIKQQERPVLS